MVNSFPKRKYFLQTKDVPFPDHHLEGAVDLHQEEEEVTGPEGQKTDQGIPKTTKTETRWSTFNTDQLRFLRTRQPWHTAHRLRGHKVHGMYYNTRMPPTGGTVLDAERLANLIQTLSPTLEEELEELEEYKLKLEEQLPLRPRLGELLPVDPGDGPQEPRN